MINVDISNVWGQVTLPNLLDLEKEVAAAHAAVTDGAGHEIPGWMRLPLESEQPELERLLAAAEQIREDSDVCVVVGIGGSCRGSQAAIELLQGPNRNLGKGKGDPMILYTGSSISTREWTGLQKLLEGKDFSVIVISKSGATVEPAIAFRNLKWLLERRYGTEEAACRIYAVTDPVRGALRETADTELWQSFSIPQGVSGRYGVLSNSGLLPMAVAGLDIGAMLRGAAQAKEEYDNLRSFENPVWLYAAMRNLMLRKGKHVELLSCWEPGFRGFAGWWQHLFAESEGKKGKGLLPVGACYPADLHCLGQTIQQGQRDLLETLVTFRQEPGEPIGSDVNDRDGLNYLAGRSLEAVADLACQGTIQAHADAGVPVIWVECEALEEQTLGELFYFMELSCAVSAYVLGVNPFNQPGMELYKRSILQTLGKIPEEAR